MSTWNSSINYAKGDPASFAGVPYLSLQNSNTNHQPDTSIGTWWEYCLATSKFIGPIPLYPKEQVSKYLGYVPLFPVISASKIVGYVPLFLGMACSKMAVHVVLFPIPSVKPLLVQPVTSA